MGVAFMKGLTEQCGGTFGITSRPGEGTEVKASIVRDHIDAPPTGDLGQMMMYAIQADELMGVTDFNRVELDKQNPEKWQLKRIFDIYYNQASGVMAE